MNNLKSSCETFFAGSQSAEKSRRSIISLPTSIFLHSIRKTILSAQQLRYTGEKLSYYFSVESFKFLAPSKVCFMYDGPYELCEKVIAKHTRGLKLILIKEVP